MISLDPTERPTFDTLLHTSRGTVFPECFYSFLHNYVSSINELSSTSVAVNNPPSTPGIHSIPASVPSTARPNSSGPLNTINEGKSETLPSDSDHRIERVWADYESIEPYIVPETAPTATTENMKVEFLPAVIHSASVPFQVRVPCRVT